MFCVQSLVKIVCWLIPMVAKGWTHGHGGISKTVRNKFKVFQMLPLGNTNEQFQGNHSKSMEVITIPPSQKYKRLQKQPNKEIRLKTRTTEELEESNSSVNGESQSNQTHHILLSAKRKVSFKTIPVKVVQNNRSGKMMAVLDNTNNLKCPPWYE